MRTNLVCTLSLVALLILACGPGGQTARNPQGAYDPKTDPLVNQAEMFQPMPKDPKAVASDQTLYYHVMSNPGSLNELFYTSHYDEDAQGPIYDLLTTFDKDFKWMPNPDMVESYEESADHKTWTFKLKAGLTWHDGAPLTPEDFRFSWQILIDDKVPAFTFRDDAKRIADVRAIDDRTVQIVHKEALPINKWVNQFPIVPKHLFDNPTERAKDPTLQQSPYYTNLARGGVVGNGPYKLVEWVANDRLVYERWDGYKGEKPYWKRIVMKIQPDRNTSLQLFKQRGIDDMELTPLQFAFETNDADFSAVGRKALNASWTISLITWNQDGSNPFFSDKRVRIAMAHALNIPYIIEKIGYNLPTQCHGIFTPGAPGYNPNIQLYDFDLKTAGKILDDAGWTRNQQDGWRYKTINGKPVKFEFEMMIPQGSQVGPKVAAVFSEDLKKIGVVLKIREIEFATGLTRLAEHNFQAYIGRWGTGVYPDTCENIWTTKMYKEGRNYGGYSNPRVDELFRLATHEFDESKRIAYFREIQKLIYEDQSDLFIWNDPTTYVVSNKIRGIELSPRGIFGFYPSYYKWWVAAGQTLH